MRSESATPHGHHHHSWLLTARRERVGWEREIDREEREREERERGRQQREREERESTARDSESREFSAGLRFYFLMREKKEEALYL
ncbi:hypothetical protein F2Q70_00035868 [Brassica cretica]|uniref:Uncharacterized protein n=1 Tax=Brassica cretica TaxID=69181 RepID=A0A8S9JR21_BRACR|nr:hypothetical protein F2Q70_00035868 [Brassica cretica]